jgi:hypothetical protein
MASGTPPQLGLAVLCKSPSSIHYHYGVWGHDLIGSSSNYRELFNLTSAAEAHIQELSFHHLHQLVNALSCEATASPSRLHGCEFYLFMDNAVAEAAFFRGPCLSLDCWS